MSQITIAELVANTIQGIVNTNDRFLPHMPGIVTLFHSRSIPDFSLKKYFMHLKQYGQLPDEIFGLGLIYLDRIMQSVPGLVISSLNIHRFFLTAMVVAVKFSDDHYFDNGYYAQVGGITNLEMNKLESSFLQMINFQLYVSSDLFIKYLTLLLQRHLASNQTQHPASTTPNPSRLESIPENSQSNQNHQNNEEDEESKIIDSDLSHEKELDLDESSNTITTKSSSSASMHQEYQNALNQNKIRDQNVSEPTDQLEVMKN